MSPDVTPVVKIRAEHQEDACRIFVIDNGVGIDMSFSEQIFGVFERLHGVESYPGTGIGLAIVRRAMESMSGSFGVESEPGKGSCFWIELRSKNEKSHESGADRFNVKRTLQIHGANDRKAML